MSIKIINARGSIAEVQTDEKALTLSLNVGLKVSYIYWLQAHLWRNVCDVHHWQAGCFFYGNTVKKVNILQVTA